MEQRTLRVPVAGLELDVLVSGSPQRGTVVLLHGFPDHRGLWKAQVPCLAAAGYRVVAPSLPGFGESQRPASVSGYTLESLLRCVLGLLDHLGVTKADVVGHDWGASLAWYMAMKAPARVERLVVLSVGHAGALFGAGGMEQRMRSWYMLWFLQDPAAVERALTANDWELFRQVLPVDKAALAGYRAAFSRPGSLSAALGIYRANVRPESFGVTRFLPFPRLDMPVLGIWSSRDPALTEAQMTASARYVMPGKWRYERIEGCGHWIPREAPEQLNALLLDFLGGCPNLEPAAKL